MAYGFNVKYGDLLISLDETSKYFLEIGKVTDTTRNDSEEKVVEITFRDNDKRTYKYENISDEFKRIMTESIPDAEIYSD